MFKINTIPFDRSTQSFAEDLLNHFVVNKQVNYYRAEIFRDGGETYWTVFLAPKTCKQFRRSPFISYDIEQLCFSGDEILLSIPM